MNVAVGHRAEALDWHDNAAMDFVGFELGRPAAWREATLAHDGDGAAVTLRLRGLTRS